MKNSSSLKKLGDAISSFRKEKGLTQTEFADLLETSQSAIARIEKGEQNLTAQMLSRINRVLGTNLFSLAGKRLNLKVEGGNELKGGVEVRTSKNSALALLYASLVNKGTTTIKEAPNIEEVNRALTLFKSIGVSVKEYESGGIEISNDSRLDISGIDKSTSLRTSNILLLIGSLSRYENTFEIPFDIKNKPYSSTLNAHQFSLEQLGIKVRLKEGTLKINASNKKPGKVVMYESSDTATINILLAAAGMDGKTTIKMASSNYQVQDVCKYLSSLGIEIEGVGTTKLIVHGSADISSNLSYNPITDPTECMFYIASSILTNSSITIKKCPLDFIELELFKLKKMGFKYEILEEYENENGFSLVDIKTYPSKLSSLDEKIYARPYPGLNIDNLPYFIPIATQAQGRTLIHDWINDERATHYTEISKLGADVILADPHRVFINGPTKLKAADLDCSLALHPGGMLLVALLGAEGTSVLRDAYTLNRWYEELFENLNNLGASIEPFYEF